MDKATFLAQLACEAFQPPVLLEHEPNGTLDSHAHPLEAKAMGLFDIPPLAVEDHAAMKAAVEQQAREKGQSARRMGALIETSASESSEA